MSKLVTGTRLRLVELTRQPLTLVMLIVLPPVVIEMYGIAVKSFPQLPSHGAAPATVGRITGTLFAVAFLAGLVGLFQVISARNGDERAAIAGFPRRTMLATRLLTMSVIALAGAVVAFIALSYRVEVTAPLLAFGTLALAGLVYGLLGVIIGTLVPQELEGSILLVFIADLDNALSSGLFPLTTTFSVPVIGDVYITDALPLYHPHELFAAAVLDGTLAEGHLLPVIGWVVGLLLIAFLAYGRSTGDGWSGLVPGDQHDPRRDCSLVGRERTSSDTLAVGTAGRRTCIHHLRVHAGRSRGSGRRASWRGNRSDDPAEGVSGVHHPDDRSVVGGDRRTVPNADGGNGRCAARRGGLPTVPGGASSAWSRVWRSSDRYGGICGRDGHGLPARTPRVVRLGDCAHSADLWRGRAPGRRRPEPPAGRLLDLVWIDD